MSGSRDRNITFILPLRNKIVCLLFGVLLLFQFQAFGQGIRVEADQEPLSHVLIRLADEYGIQLSFDDRLLSDYTVTVDRQFGSPEKAISYLIDPLPLDYQKSGEVFIIFPQRSGTVPGSYGLSGRIVDSRSGEALPYTHLMIGEHGMITDFSGYFSITSAEDSVFSMTVSHLGYYLLDTVLHAGENHTISLWPSRYALEEVTIEGRSVERSGQVGEQAGMIRLNHQIAYRLPGNGDDAVFNFLRLQPGILAAGEQSSEMIIWGGYPGHSQLIFDGFTIFGPKNFNDNISFVNPYMAKDIRIYKGGYPARYGGRVGGIVEISGIDGNRKKPSVNLNINNMTLSGMASVPVKKQAALTLAYRNTYYNLVDAEDLGLLTDRDGRGPGRQVDISVFPDYRFNDMNFKFSGSTGSGDPYFISLFEGRDHFFYAVNEERNVIRVEQEATEQSRQLGGTAFFGKSWKSGFLSNFSLSYSGLSRELKEKQELFHLLQEFTLSSSELQYKNSVKELTFKNNHYFSLSDRHRLVTGVEVVYHDVDLFRDSLDVMTHSGRNNAGRINLFAQDAYQLFPSVSLRPGVRIDYPFYLQRLYIQPRLLFSADLSERWKFNGAWGIYNQFISEASVIDDYGNFRYFWTICDNEGVPVLRAQHFVGGLVFRQDGLTVSLETYYKTVEGITRYVDLWDRGLPELFRGRARIYGMDLLVKSYFGKHEAWASYTLGRAEEYFPYFTGDHYAPAPQDQRHEIKGALLLDLSPFYLSVNYVYGSGLADGSFYTTEILERYPYSRLDASFIYRLNIKKVRMETGISILNIFNRENIKYSNLIRIPESETSTIGIHAEAVPFTPTLYLNLSF